MTKAPLFLSIQSSSAASEEGRSIWDLVIAVAATASHSRVTFCYAVLQNWEFSKEIAWGLIGGAPKSRAARSKVARSRSSDFDTLAVAICKHWHVDLAAVNFKRR
jgi:hypothetical protein